MKNPKTHLKTKIKRKVFSAHLINSKRNIGWSLGSWFKKPKTSPGNDTTKDDSTQSTEEEIMKSKPKKLEKFGNYAKSLLKGIADNVQSSFMEPAALGDPVWGDFPSPSAPVNKTEETKNENEGIYCSFQ